MSDKTTELPEVRHATPALIDAVEDLGRFAAKYRYPNTAVVLVVGESIVARVPQTANARFEQSGWTRLHDEKNLWTLDARDVEYEKKRKALASLTIGFAGI